MSRLATRLGWCLGTALAVGAVAAVGTVVPGARVAARPLDVAASRTVVCPATDPAKVATDVAVFAATGPVTVHALTGFTGANDVPPGATRTFARAQSPQVVSLDSGASAGATSVTAATTGLERGLAASPCLPQTTDAWFTGLTSSATVTTDIVLTNSDDTAATVDLAIFGAQGRVVTAGAGSRVVPPRETIRVPIGPLVTDDKPVTVRMHTSQGRVAAYARSGAFRTGQTAGSGVDWVAPSSGPADTAVIGGVPAGGGARQLIITNPGARSGQVHVEMLTVDGAVVPSDTDTVPVGAEQTVAIPLAGSTQGDPVGVRVTGTVPVTAAVAAVNGAADDAGADFATAPARPAFAGVALLPYASKGVSSMVVLANPGQAAASATVRALDDHGKPLGPDQPVTLGPGTSGALRLPVADATVVRVEVTAGAVVGDVVLTSELPAGMHGLAVLPLGSSQLGSARIDPVEDLGEQG